MFTETCTLLSLYFDEVSILLESVLFSVPVSVVLDNCACDTKRKLLKEGSSFVEGTVLSVKVDEITDCSSAESVVMVTDASKKL